MTKSEFLDCLTAEADQQKCIHPYADIVEAVREVLNDFPEGIEIETEKGIKDVYTAMETFARANAAAGGCGCCPPAEVRRIIIEVFNLNNCPTQAASAADIDVLDLF